ncbi:hypothetical protein [Heyndrickxia acidicola]|uniref:Uncharacterized protein n=1 Tax=Heyndrickxia acidicola TaxID=209389 RepID=A0ABU6MF55_9BACI|nr:hypothetical protein [Heyndrickxia acidicola]MED1203281.1 hypothetical protein [Heyndrickxia acidicola]
MYSTKNQIVQVDKYGNVKGGKTTGHADILVTVTTKDHFVLYLTEPIEGKVNLSKGR